MNRQPGRYLLGLGLMTAILAASTASIFIRLAQVDAPSLVIAALRLTFASIAVVPFALSTHRGEIRALTLRDIGLGILSGFFLAAHFATWISSLAYTSVASSVVIVGTGPLWVALLAPIFLKERSSRAVFAGLGIALLGGGIIGFLNDCTWDGGLSCPALSEILYSRAMIGNLLALLGAWAFCGYLLIGRSLRGRMALLPYISLVYSTSAIVLVLVILTAHQTPFGYLPVTYGWIILLALVPQLIGHSTYNWALRYLPAVFVAVSTLGEPIGSTALALFILHEQPTFAVIIGGALVLFGIIIATRGGAADGAALGGQE